MALIWHSIWIFVLLFQCIRCENNDSNESKSSESVDNSGTHMEYDSDMYSTAQSSQSDSNNAYNSPQSSLSSSESSGDQTYGSGYQTEDQFDKKDRKTLILAIPVKLSLPKSDQDNYEPSLPQQPVNAESIRTESQSSYSNSNNPYLPSYEQSSQQYSSDSANSYNSDENSAKSAPLQPLSHKIYSSPESQLKSVSYSTQSNSAPKPHNEHQYSQYSSDYTNEQKYKNPDEINNYRLPQNPYLKNNNNYRYKNPRDEYKGVYEYFGTTGNNYKQGKSRQFKDENKYENYYETRAKLRDRAKALYDSMADNKPEYDYESSSESDDEENTKVNDNYQYNRNRDNNKNSHYLRNNRKNAYNGKAYGPKPDAISHYYNRESGQTVPAITSDSFDGWPNYFYKPNLNSNWPQIGDSVDGNVFNFLNGYRNKNQENVKNGLYAPAYDLLADTQIKAASNPIPFKTMNSKIYSAAAAYQPINLFAGYGRDYSLVDMNGELYPSPLLAQTPPRKQHKPMKQNEYVVEPNRETIKPPRRNPLLMRPSFMSGLRSVAKPLAIANYTPFSSASTTTSFLSALPSLPSLPTSFINKSIPRQIFPLLYG